MATISEQEKQINNLKGVFHFPKGYMDDSVKKLISEGFNVIFDEIDPTEKIENFKSENEQILDILKALKDKLDTITEVLNKIHILK